MHNCACTRVTDRRRFAAGPVEMKADSEVLEKGFAWDWIFNHRSPTEYRRVNG